MRLVTKTGEFLGEFVVPLEVELNLKKLGRHEFQNNELLAAQTGPSGLIARSVLYGLGRDRYKLVGMTTTQFAELPGVVLSLCNPAVRTSYPVF